MWNLRPWGRSEEPNWDASWKSLRSWKFAGGWWQIWPRELSWKVPVLSESPVVGREWEPGSGICEVDHLRLPESQNCPHPGLMCKVFFSESMIFMSSVDKSQKGRGLRWIRVSWKAESYLPWLTLEKWKCLSTWPKGKLMFNCFLGDLNSSWDLFLIWCSSFQWRTRSSAVFKSSGAKKLDAIQFLFFMWDVPPWVSFWPHWSLNFPREVSVADIQCKEKQLRQT